MKYLFAPSGMRILESLCFTKTLFAFDYDGTLSKIVPQPSEAHLPPKISDLLQHLSGYAPIAIISGRSKIDLKSRIPFKANYLVGNHGLEGLDEPANVLKKSKRICSAWRSSLEAMLSTENLGPGIEIENKIYTIAIHYRHSRQKRRVRSRLLSLAESLNPAPRVIKGKSVINLVPPGAPHKGVALLEIMKREGVTSVFYIGDDDTDEDVFSLPESCILSVRVGRKASSTAPFFIKRQSQVRQLLLSLIQFYEAG